MPDILVFVQAPVAGGFLAQPAAKLEIFDNEFFCTFPFILPLLLSVILYIISFISKIKNNKLDYVNSIIFPIFCYVGAYFVFEETLTKRRSRYQDEINVNSQKDLQSNNSSTDDELSRYTSFDTDEAKNKGCCTSTYQHILTVQKDQLTCLSNCISGCKCKRSNLDSDLPPPLKERLLFIVKAIINRSVLSSVAVSAIIGSANVMIYEVN